MALRIATVFASLKVQHNCFFFFSSFKIWKYDAILEYFCFQNFIVGSIPFRYRIIYNFHFQEFPFVRYRAAKGPDDATTPRELIPTKLATLIWNNITTYRSSIPNFPATETCELLIVDRSVDQVS